MLLAELQLLAFSWRDKLASMSWLEMVLWVGLISLSLALLIMMSTRLGHVRPVSKCVALSVFAHLLFLCYAYGTRMSAEGGTFAGDPFVTVTYLSPDEADALDAVESDPLPEPPEAVPQIAMLAVEPEAPVPLAAEQAPEEAPAESAPAVPDLLPVPEPPTASVEPLSPTEVADEEQPPAATAEVEVTAQVQESASREVPVSRQEDSSPAADLPADPAPVPPDPAPAETRVAEVPPESADVVERPAEVTPPREASSVPEPYRLRTAPNRKPFAFSFGATDETEAAVRAALTWLAAQQKQDGRWNASEYGAGRETKTLGQDRQGAGSHADTGISGLALLAFLGAGNTHLEGDFRETVQHGLEFLIASQSSDGNLAGNAKLFERMYCHGIASLALSEAYAMSGDPRLLPALRHAIGYSLAAQDRNSGGWRYQPGDRGDMSQFGWQVMAMRSAQLGGLEVPATTHTLMLKFLDSASVGPHKGLGSYRPGERPTRTMTAEALTCRMFLGTSPSEASVNEAISFVLQELPGQGEPNLYYWYYATLSLFQTQGPAWQTWNRALQQQLLPRQRKDGPLAGSWDTRDVWGGYGGRIYTTAMASLCLEVYYRYLPIYGQ